MIIENDFNLTGQSDCFYNYDDENGLLKVHVQSCNFKLAPENLDNWVETILTKHLDREVNYTKEDLDLISARIARSHGFRVDWL